VAVICFIRSGQCCVGRFDEQRLTFACWQHFTGILGPPAPPPPPTPPSPPPFPTPPPPCPGTWDDVSFELTSPGREPLTFKSQQSLINYNLNAGTADDPEPQLPAADMFVIPAGLVQPGMVAGLSANDGVVIIGSAAVAARDRHISAYGAMGGSLVIAKVIRGVEAGGEVRRMAWYLEAILLTLVVMLIVLAFWYGRKAREYLKPMEGLHWAMRIARTPINLLTNPVIIKILIGIGVFWVGAGASYFLLDDGLWLGLAAPAYAAALNEAREDFEELMESLRNAETKNV